MFGLLNVNKPPGPTSYDVIRTVRQHLPRDVRIGHAGTLDPFADGVLVLCLGPATRLADCIQSQPKRYRVTCILGATSPTDDTEAASTPTPGALPPTPAELEAALAGFMGDIQQVPPAHSAVRVAGRRAYDHARAGEAVRLSARTVTVHAIECVEYAWPRLVLEIACGAGTYIRAIVRDLGAALGVGAYACGLTRTAIGPFALAEAVAPEALDLAADLIAPRRAVEHLPAVTAETEQIAQLRQGHALRIPAAPIAELLAVLDAAGELLALACCTDGWTVQPRKVFLDRAV
jgi:tRNA pseudouridine55 synthase